jgi:hypothetical protein
MATAKKHLLGCAVTASSVATCKAEAWFSKEEQLQTVLSPRQTKLPFLSEPEQSPERRQFTVDGCH